MEPLRGDAATTPAGDARVLTRGCRVADASMATLLSLDGRPQFAWSGPERRVWTVGATATLTATGEDRFESVRSAATDLFADLERGDGLPRAARPRLFGGFSFHNGNGTTGPWEGFEPAEFVLPAVQVTWTDDGTWLTVTAAGEDAAAEADDRLAAWRERLSSMDTEGTVPPPGVERKEITPTREQWRTQVEDAVARVADGSLRKVVLAQALTAELGRDLSVGSALARLADTYPDCYRFVVAPEEGGHFFGATPERLVTLRGRTVRTEALAGSTGRGDTPAEDEWLAEELLGSEKDVHEHELVAEAIKDQLEPLAAAVQTGERTVRRLATVQHLRTPITAELAADEHVLDLVEALHPTPAVGGLPPDRALETIRETETFDRGWYAAPVGWFDAAGNGTFAVAIRSAIARERRATLFAGAGIVGDSDPDREWDEVQLKYRPMLDELEGDDG